MNLRPLGYENHEHIFGLVLNSLELFWITWYKDEWWLINNGQGGAAPKWVSANDCWFGTDGYCY